MWVTFVFGCLCRGEAAFLPESFGVCCSVVSACFSCLFSINWGTFLTEEPFWLRNHERKRGWRSIPGEESWNGFTRPIINKNRKVDRTNSYKVLSPVPTLSEYYMSSAKQELIGGSVWYIAHMEYIQSYRGSDRLCPILIYQYFLIITIIRVSEYFCGVFCLAVIFEAIFLAPIQIEW